MSMNLCNLKSVNTDHTGPGTGEYLVLVEHPGEGISVHSQHILLELAVGAVLFGGVNASRMAIVKLIRVDINPTLPST